jgi:tripartite ATP-independent transporter DctM subunit
MDPIILSIIAIAAFIVLLMLGLHIGLSLITVGFVGYGLLMGWDAAIGLLKIVPFKTVGSFSLAVVPLFVLMGQLSFYSGISSELYDTCYKWFGRFRGGLGISTIGACALFSAICGSAPATAATMGTVALPEMSRYNYRKNTSTGLIASAGTMGILIPPSVAFIVYGTITGDSIGALFAAGVFPGILMCAVFIVIIILITRRDPGAMPAGEKFSLREMFHSLKGGIGFLLLFVICLGGIFGGVISPSEGGSIGSLGAFVILIARHKASFKNIAAALRDTVRTTTMIFTIMIGATIFGNFLTASHMPAELAENVLRNNMPGGLIMAIIIIVFIVLGCFIDALPLTMILVPIFMPIVNQIGWNGIWFGVIVVICMMIGLITPPVGMNCYVMSGVAKDVKLQDIFKGAFPFLIGEVITMLIIITIPQIALFLPDILYG